MPVGLAVHRSPLAAVAAGLALVVPLAFFGALAAESWAPRLLLVVVAAGLGFPVLVALLRSPARWPAAVALALAGWAALCAALSAHPVQSWWGELALGTGALFVAALAGSWAIGVASGRQAGEWVQRALLVAVGVNAAVAVAQMAFDLSSLDLPLFDERSSGLWGNPVFLGAFLVGGYWLVLPRFPSRPLPWGAFTVLVAAGVQLAGSRFAFALLLVTLAVGAARLVRATSGGWFPALALTGCVLVGLAVGAGLAQVGGGASVSSRTQGDGAGGGVRPRVESWWSARHAVADRPVVGAGPGRYRAATAPFRTLRLARALGPDRLYADAHNLGVEYLTTTGVGGLALLAAWLVLAFRRARVLTPLGGFAALLLAMHLVEPQNVGLTPLAFLALGVAAPVPEGWGPSRALGAGAGLGLVAALIAAAVLVAGFWHLDQAALDLDPGQARQARQGLPPWPETRSLQARAYVFAGKARRDPGLFAEARRWYRAAVRADPADPGPWNDLAEAELSDGLLAEADAHFRQALERNPWSSRALNGLGRIARSQGRASEGDAWFRRSLRADPRQVGLRRMLAEG